MGAERPPYHRFCAAVAVWVFTGSIIQGGDDGRDSGVRWVGDGWSVIKGYGQLWAVQPLCPFYARFVVKVGSICSANLHLPLTNRRAAILSGPGLRNAKYASITTPCQADYRRFFQPSKTLNHIKIVIARGVGGRPILRAKTERFYWLYRP